MEGGAEIADPSGASGNVEERRPRKERKEKKHKKKDRKKEKKHREKKEEGGKVRKEKHPIAKRGQSFAVPMESALPLSHALLEHFIAKVDPSLKEAEATLRRIRENLGVQEDNGIADLLSTLSTQDAFVARLEILKSKLQTTETIVQVAIQDDRVRRGTANENDAPRPEYKKNEVIYSTIPTLPKANGHLTNQPSLAALDQRKGTGQYLAMPPRDAHTSTATTVIAKSMPAAAPLQGAPAEAAPLIKPSEVAASSGAGRYQARSLSRRTAELYAQYGDRVDNS